MVLAQRTLPGDELLREGLELPHLRVRVGQRASARRRSVTPRVRVPSRAVADPSGCSQTSRGVTESSRRNASVSPFASIEGRPSSEGPLVSAVTWPSSVAR